MAAGTGGADQDGWMDLNPAQQEVVDVLGAARESWPRFEPDLRHHLRTALETATEPIIEDLGANTTLWLSKHAVNQVHGCERRYMAELDDPFEWSVPLARGTVAHKAIELSIHWRGEPVPLAMVDEALARLEEGVDGFAQWLQAISDAELAELRAEVNDRVMKFLECWPPLKREWRPVTESRLRAEFFEQRLVLAGKVDLTLGQAKGLQAGKVLVDLKTGGFSPTHRDDLRFYALIETIRLGSPPRLLASYYLDQGRFVPESVTEALLESTLARVVGAVGKIVALRDGGLEPTATASTSCRWCPALPGCETGQTWIDDAEDDSLPE